MKAANILTVILLGSALGTGTLIFSSPTEAEAGWQHSERGTLALTSEQRQQIANLSDAFHDRIKGLDWSVQDGSHDPNTLRTARELRLALRAEIRDVMTQEQLEHIHSARKTCPHGGQANPGPQPVKTDSATLYL
jgi:hypothetical protein